MTSVSIQLPPFLNLSLQQAYHTSSGLGAAPNFHVIFTLPEQRAAIALQNKRVVYNLLFAAASATLQTIAADPRHLGADIGFLAVLHTWDQTLRHHPHLHCVVPGGGLSVDGEGWRSCRRGFFLPVNVLARLFRRLFLQGLECAYEKGKLSFHGSCAFLAKPTAFKRLLKSVRGREWWVYAKPPFGGPAQVLSYLGRYTHRVAISNHRLLSLKDDKVTFSWRDNRHGQLRSTMTLSAEEFIRRFLLHVLPRGFQRIRQFGILANRRRDKLARCRQLLGATEQTVESLCQDYQSLYQTVNAASLRQCPACRIGTMKFCSHLLALTNYGAPHPQQASCGGVPGDRFIMRKEFRTRCQQALNVLHWTPELPLHHSVLPPCADQPITS